MKSSDMVLLSQLVDINEVILGKNTLDIAVEKDIYMVCSCIATANTATTI